VQTTNSSEMNLNSY